MADGEGRFTLEVDYGPGLTVIVKALVFVRLVHDHYILIAVAILGTLVGLMQEWPFWIIIGAQTYALLDTIYMLFAIRRLRSKLQFGRESLTFNRRSTHERGN